MLFKWLKRKEEEKQPEKEESLDDILKKYEDIDVNKDYTEKTDIFDINKNGWIDEIEFDR